MEFWNRHVATGRRFVQQIVTNQEQLTHFPRLFISWTATDIAVARARVRNLARGDCKPQ